MKHARHVTVQFKEGKIAEAEALWHELVVPGLRALNGFRGALFLTDESSGEGASVVWFETKADLLASETGEQFEDTFAKFEPLFAIPPVKRHLAVTVEALAASEA